MEATHAEPQDNFDDQNLSQQAQRHDSDETPKATTDGQTGAADSEQDSTDNNLILEGDPTNVGVFNPSPAIPDATSDNPAAAQGEAAPEDLPEGNPS